VFTGLVQEVGRVEAVEHGREGTRLRVEARFAAELREGDSVLVNGVCLTALEPSNGAFGADLSPETVRRSSLGELERGSRVNLELPLRAADRLGGHIVQGHVDAVARVVATEQEGLARNLRVEPEPDVLRYVVEKGSVAIDGVSLTVTRVDERGFEVSLIPETLERTNLTDAVPGTRVNLEVDVIAKYVEKLVAP
jgi:riboflavin synthase